MLMKACGFYLAKALLIGVRYSIVRQQFKTQFAPNGQKVERSIIDYQTHLHKLCPLVSSSLAYSFAISELLDIYNKMMNNIEKKQDFSLLGPMHTILCGLKTLWCNDMYEGVKKVRESCGAAGFLN
jgi:acyl-CoA oxidase